MREFSNEHTRGYRKFNDHFDLTCFITRTTQSSSSLFFRRKSLSSEFNSLNLSISASRSPAACRCTGEDFYCYSDRTSATRLEGFGPCRCEISRELCELNCYLTKIPLFQPRLDRNQFIPTRHRGLPIRRLRGSDGVTPENRFIIYIASIYNKNRSHYVQIRGLKYRRTRREAGALEP